MTKEDYLLKLSLLEQEANKIQEQLQAVNQQISELETLKLSLDGLDEKGKEILASLGKGVFVKSEIKDGSLFVNVGAGAVLKKSPEETIQIVDKQINQLEEIKGNLTKAIGDINIHLQKLVIEAQREDKEKNDKQLLKKVGKT